MKKIYKYILQLIIVITIIALDQLTKHFFYGTSLTLLTNVLGIRNLKTLNTGGAWGILGNNLTFLIILTFLLISLLVLFNFLSKITHPLFLLSISFIIGGALGNLVDRLLLGGVRDFLYFIFYPSYPTFNLADCFVLVGVILFAIYILFVHKENKNGKNSLSN